MIWKKKSFEEVEEGIQPEGATDEYYSLVSLNYTSNEFYGNSESLSIWLDIGIWVVTLAKSYIKYGSKFLNATVDLGWDETKSQIKSSKLYRQTNKYYYKYATATYDITDALGHKLRTVTYTNLKINTTIERVYS